MHDLVLWNPTDLERSNKDPFPGVTSPMMDRPPPKFKTESTREKEERESFWRRSLTEKVEFVLTNVP